MTERQLLIECAPQIMELCILVKDMTQEQYNAYKTECLEDTGKKCPGALNFTKNIFRVIEWTLAM